MSTHFRKTKLERIIKRWEAKRPLYDGEKLKLLEEIIAELRHEFTIKEEK